MIMNTIQMMILTNIAMEEQCGADKLFEMATMFSVG